MQHNEDDIDVLDNTTDLQEIDLKEEFVEYNDSIEDNNNTTTPITTQQEVFLFGLSKYHLLVLTSAWLGWSFDIYDGVIFSYAAPLCVPMLLGYTGEERNSAEAKEAVALWTAILTSILLIGWAIGGIVFGVLTDKLGRSRTMMITILCYSIATGACAFSFHISFLAVFRFISALGIGGEWASGASLVAEVMPSDKRVIGGIVMYTAAPFGSLLAYFVTFLLTSSYTNVLPDWISWRIVFATAVIPSLVGVLIRFGLKEPESWNNRKENGSWRDLFGKDLWWNTLSSLCLVVFSLIAWYVTTSFIPITGIFLAKQYVTRNLLSMESLKKTQDIFIAIGVCSFNVGGLLGTFLSYPLSQKLGRVWTFRIYFFFSALFLATYAIPLPEIVRLLMLFPCGIFMFGIFAVYTFYLPEVFPTFVRGTGCGFSYNAGRVITAIFPFISGVLVSRGVSPIYVLLGVSIFPVIGFLFSWLRLIETRDVVI
jgi:MFS family permease